MTKNNSSPTSPRQFNILIKAYIEAERELEDNPWGPVPEQKTAHAAAKSQIDVARDELRDAIATAPWGQNGSVFITYRAVHVGAYDGVKTLHINNLPRVKVTINGHSGRPWLTDVYTEEQGKQMVAELKKQRRREHERYMAERNRLLMDIRQYGVAHLYDFGDWWYSDGDDGGTFHRPSHNTPTIAAIPAMKAVWGEDWDYEMYEYVPTQELQAEEEVDRRYHGAKY